MRFVAMAAAEPNATPVAGAACTLSSPAIPPITVVTPGVTNLPKSKHNVEVRCSKEGHQDGAGVLNSDVAVALASNILIGGLIGTGIDLATGAANKYAAQVTIVMPKLPPPAPEKPVRGKRVAAMKPS